MFWAPDTLADLISTATQLGITVATLQTGILRLSEANYSVLGHSSHNNGRVNQKPKYFAPWTEWIPSAPCQHPIHGYHVVSCI